MSVKTVMICSKFSPSCVQTLESLKQKNISTDPFIKILWIDHPNMRNIIKSSNLIKTVPAIIVHDETRDLSIVYEGDKFKEYMITFIQNHQAPQAHLMPHSMQNERAVLNHGLFHAQNQVMLDHHHAKNTINQSVQDLSKHQVHLEERSVQHVQEHRDGIKDNIGKKMFGPSGLIPEDRNSYLDAIRVQAQKADDKFSLLQEQNRQRLLEERQVQMETAINKHQVQMTQAVPREVQREALAQQQQLRIDENNKLQRMYLLDRLKNDPSNNGLSEREIEQLAKMEELQIKYRELERNQVHEKGLHQIRAQAAKTAEEHQQLTTLSTNIQELENQKQSIIQQLRMLPPIPLKDKQIMEAKQRQTQQSEISLKSQMSHEAQKPYFQAMSKKYEIEKEAQRIQEELNKNPQSTELVQQLQVLQHLYNQNNQQLATLKPSEPSAPEPVHTPVVPQQLQQEQMNSQVELHKEQERKQRVEGFTNIMDLDGEESLYDHQQRQRPKGTDVHQSEEAMKQHLQVTKRNSLNQQVRAMTNNREIRPPKGVGHDSMAKTSLTVLEQPREEVTSLDRLSHGEIDHSMMSIPPSESLDIIDDMIDGGDIDAPIDEPEIQSRSQIKKKASIVDRAKELEKGRM